MPTLVVETGTGTNPNANCYITLDDAVDYHEARLHVTAWQNANSTERTRALIMATRVIDAACQFKGYKKIQTSPLAWPRVRVPDCEVYSGNYNPLIGGGGWQTYYDENSIPPLIAQATALEALELLRGDRSADADTKGINSIGLGQGALSLDFNSADAVKSLSDEVRRTLALVVKYFRFAGGGGNRRVVRVR